MDKSRIHESRLSCTFEDGVTQFLDFAFVNNIDGRIKCPCKNCNNAFRHDRNIVEEHMIYDGLDIGYFSNKWIYNGELDSTQTRLNNDQSGQVDDMHGMLHNAFGVVDGGGGEFDGVDLGSLKNDNSGGGGGDENDNGGDREILNDDAKRFYNLLKNVEQELYLGCKKFTKLSFHIKCLYGLSDKSITILLELFKEALPEGETLLKSFYQTEKIISDLGPEYNKIDVLQLYHQGDLRVNKDLKRLARDPNKIASRFKKYLINGFRFQIKDIDIRSKTQNSGVVVIVKTSSFASVKDKNPIVGDVSYFGHLIKVIKLNYYGWRKVALFKCDLIEIKSNRGTKKDELGFILVNPSCLLKTEEPIILASQAIQVFYVEDPVHTKWHVVVFTKPKDLYDMDKVANVGDL
ncbi:hypothetical protein LWI28_001182 [Acer negundo]|uniref:Transposase-associated domain-containing protein n=1 Tax=Acer negundo TaxID=4023 RepID=A0AAD5JIG1_ACENE|nr:hypothetical protein LWI28_001182 [Acer negundo]